MDNFMLALNTVAPLFLLMMLGYFLKRIGLLTDVIIGPLNKLVFSVFLSTSLFNNIYTTKLEDAWNGRAVLFVVICVLAVFALLWLIIPRIEKDKRKASVMMQSIYRSNIIILGLPIAAELCGAENTGLMSIVIAIVVPIYNVLSVFIFGFMDAERPPIKKTLLDIAKNPLIIGSVLGVLFLVCGIRLPYMLEKTVSNIASITTPLALIVLGGFFDFKKLGGNVKQLVIALSGRLVIVPLICMSIAIALGFRGSDLIAMLAAFAAPSAVTSFTMAKQMKGDADLAAQIVVLGTLFSIVTIFLWIFLLKQLGLF